MKIAKCKLKGSKLIPHSFQQSHAWNIGKTRMEELAIRVPTVFHPWLG